MKYFFPITIDFKKSYSSYLVDKDSGEEYLDFFSMYSSLPLGYNHPIFNNEFKDKIDDFSYIRMSNNVCKSEEFEEFINLFSKYTFSDNFHFTCTGALAVESALKTAMHYKKSKNPMVLSVKNSFHGVNSWGFTTSQVGVTAKRMEYFLKNDWLDLELDEIIKYLESNDLKNLTAIIIEPIQATSGDIYLDKNKLKVIRQLCRDNNICFILDEIQTGFGASGKMWYYEYLDLVPDILIFGKKAQVCGIVVGDKYNGILKNPYQKLDVTFDGELIDIVRATYVLKAFEQYNILENINRKSEKIREKLEPIMFNYRSVGGLIAFDFRTEEERDNFVKTCFDNKLLVNKAGSKTVRIRPNLALNKDELELFISTIMKVVNEKV